MKKTKQNYKKGYNVDSSRMDYASFAGNDKKHDRNERDRNAFKPDLKPDSRKNSRHLQLAQSFKKIISEYVQHGTLLPECSLTSVVEVRVNPSLSFIDVTISSAKDQKETVKLLNENSKEIKKYCSQSMKHLRYMPNIRFHEDDTVETLLRFV